MMFSYVKLRNHFEVMAASALAVWVLLGLYSTARADVISFSPATDFSTTPTTISFGNPTAASFTLTYLGSNPNDITYTVDGVSTDGNGAVNTSGVPGPGQQPIPYQIGSDIGNNGYTTFTRFAAPAGIAYSSAADFIGIDFTLADGLHYGYIEVNGPTLVSYAYQSTPGADILTGAQTSVPEPASLPLFLAGLIGLGFIGVRRRTS
jgi:hypothetical protein